MCKAGGPRCKGGGRGQAAGAARPANSAVIVGGEPGHGKTIAPGSVPSREDADRLGAALAAGRTDAFGQPLSEADRRLFALRESGWTGPIDQDGYPATTGEAADILRDMARRRGETPDW